VFGACINCHVDGIASSRPPTQSGKYSNLCGSCHNASAPWSPVTNVDHTQTFGYCVDRHDGNVAIGKSTSHVITTNICEACHGFSDWFLNSMDHNLNSTKNTPQYVVNEGISGETTGGTLDTRINSILERHDGLNKALIMLGINDLTSISSGLHCSDSNCNGTYKGNLQSLINTFDPGVTPIIDLPPPVFDTDDPLSGRKYIEVIKTQLTGNYEVRPDYYTYFLSADEDRGSLFNDKVHPNAMGHVMLAHIWSYHLNENTGLPTRNELPFVMEDLCIKLTSSACEVPLL